MLAAPHEVLFSRAAHGSIPVRVHPPQRRGWSGTYERLSNVDGEVQATYYSAKALIADLTRNPRHGYSFDRYFNLRQRTPVPTPPAGGGVLDLFRPPLGFTEAITVVVTQPLLPAVVPITVLVPKQPELGIDLVKRGHEVRKLMFAGFGTRIATHGYDPEEVLQEVFRGILARNVGKCPFDATKSSFGHYVFMVIECILNNFHRKESRRRSMEQVGVVAPRSMREDSEASGGMVDAALLAEKTLVNRGDYVPPDGGMPSAIRKLTDHLIRKAASGAAIDPLSLDVARLLADGNTRMEIARALKVKQARVTLVISSLQEHTADWL